MVSDIAARRVPWVAAALSLLSAGVGHLYCGRIAKGLPLYFAWLLVPLGVTFAAILPSSPTNLVLLVLLPVFFVFGVYVYAAVDAWRLARYVGSDYSLRDYNRVSLYGLLIVVQMVYSIGLVVGVRRFAYEAFAIPTSSMSPTILAGDRILARKAMPPHHVPQRGDLIVYRNATLAGTPNYVGRVVAVAGDQVKIRGERLVVNGKELERDRVPDENFQHLGERVTGEVAFERNAGQSYLVAYGGPADGKRAPTDLEAVIPARHVFVLGDNRDHARDSRDFGSIPVADIVGQVEYIYWPAATWSRFGVANDRLP